MKKGDLIITGDDSLRQKAEKQYKKSHSLRKSTRTDADTLKLIHELEVHQIELEMQYEELLLQEAKAETATEKFTALYDFAPAGYFTLSRECIVSELNLSGARMLGMDRSLLVNRNFRHFISPDSKTVFDDFLRKVFETDYKQTCEIIITNEDKSSYNVLIEGLFSESEGKCLLTATDITSLRRADEKLRNSEERYRRLFETAQDGIFILDAFNGKIVDVNPYLIKLLGYSYEEFIGKELWEIGIFNNKDDSKAGIVELQNNGYIRYEDRPLVTKEGNQINVEYVSNVYLVDTLKVIQCNIRDITDRKKAEEALKQSEARLRELNATKDKFFSIIAHDLKSPFTSIIGLSELLVQQVHKHDYEGIEEYATIIQNSSWRAMDLLTNLIEWSRSQTGRMEFNPSKFELVELINEVTILSNDSAKQKSITISMDLPFSISVFADKPMISTIFRNLISNAIKFTNPGGNIIISARKNEHELTITVSDSGVGIKKEAINKLFRIEESISTTGTGGEEGTGLGLLLCHEFVLKHGGKIWAESEPGDGTKFNFTIPLSTL